MRVFTQQNCTHVIKHSLNFMREKDDIIVVMYIERIPNRNSPPAVLLRESYPEEGKVRKGNLPNLSKLPSETLDHLKILLNFYKLFN